MGPGAETMDHQKADGVSLMTPASGPQDDQKVELTALVTVSTSADTVAPHNNQAKATWDQGQPMKTSASTQSASYDHPNAKTRDPSRLSRDPEDTMGNDEHHLDAHTEPSNMPEGIRG